MLLLTWPLKISDTRFNLNGKKMWVNKSHGVLVSYFISRDFLCCNVVWIFQEKGFILTDWKSIALSFEEKVFLEAI